MEDIIQLNQDYQILICRLCQAAVRPGSSIETHFRQKHLLKGQVLKDIKDYYGTLELADPKLAATPEDNSEAIEQLVISHGYSCNACRYLTIARDNIVRHWREAGHGAAEERWTEVRLQTWMGGHYARYWIVRDDSDSNGPSDTADEANARSQSAMDEVIAASEARLKEKDAARLRKGDLKEDIDRDSSWRAYKLQTYFTAKGLIDYFLVEEDLSLPLTGGALAGSGLAMASTSQEEGKLFKDLKADIIQASRDLDKEAEIVQDVEASRADRKYFQQIAETPFGHVLQWRLYLFAASRTSLTKHQARWSLDGEMVDYMGTKLHMEQVIQLVESEFRQAYLLLYDELLFGMRDITLIEAWRLHDDLDIDDYGASWLTDERNREILAGTHDALLRQIEGRADLRQVFVRLDPNGGVRLCPKAIAIYKAHIQEFLKRILAPISVPSGPPLRSPELLSITYINTGARRRSVFL
ncbi:Protein of unknown function DUF3505 [Fusarium oxysporum f. sp. vasinfectum]|nr:Protein of unknown function DUF3505 [Fusarium oxysporum f. sp. vasinfectum]